MSSPTVLVNLKDLSPTKDGSLVIYNRPTADGGLNPVYQVKIKLPNQKRIRLSTKTKDENEAIRIAKEKYEELFIKVKTNKPVRLIGVKQVIKEFNEWYLDTKSVKVKRENRQHYLNTLNKYPYEFFVELNNDISIDLIDDDLIQDYFNWRRDTHGVSNNTLRREMTIIRSLLTFCVREKRYLDIVPDYRLPQRERNRRPAWTIEEYRTIVRKMRKWVDADPNGRVRRQRFYFQQFFLLSANCGARVGEMRNLKWNQIRTEKYSDDEERVILSVEGKTGRRDVVCQSDATTFLDRLFDYRTGEVEEISEDEFVFCHFDGEPIASMKKSFLSLMDWCDTERDMFGEKYTIYSLRHFYATMRLNNQVSVYDLASNMGTSTDMISRFYDKPNNIQRGLSISKTENRTSAKNSKEKKKYPYK